MPTLKLLQRMIAATLMVAACAKTNESRLNARVIYEGHSGEPKHAIPATADPQVPKECASSTIAKVGSLLGIDTDTKIAPPLFIGLWPVAKPERPESHGKIDEPAVGTPRPGDRPFLHKVVCEPGTVDWKIGEQLDGEYYVAVWLDSDMNGFPSESELFSVYRGEPAAQAGETPSKDSCGREQSTFSGEATAPAQTICFRSSQAVQITIGLGSAEPSFSAAIEEIRLNIKNALITGDGELFAGQFHPLRFRDAFNRSYNELNDLFATLTTQAALASTEVDWLVPLQAGDATREREVVLQQDKTWPTFESAANKRFSLRVKWAFPREGAVQLIDWKPLVEQSGLLELAGEPSSEEFDSASILRIPFKFVSSDPQTVWFSAEQFVPSTTEATGGRWELIPSSTSQNPRALTYAQGRIAEARITPGNDDNALTELVLTQVALSDDTVIRATLVPIDPAGKTGYVPWAGFPSTLTEPSAGNYLRVYFYGSQYLYRSGVTVKP